MRTASCLAAAVAAWFGADWLVEHVDALFLFETPVRLVAMFAALEAAENLLRSG